VLLIFALLLGLGAIGAIYVADQSDTQPRLSDVDATDAQDAIQELKDFIAENTR
jgi:CHASE1-domain containing sensor protein